MRFKSFNLFLIGIFICILFYRLPWYNSWINAKILCENCTIYNQSQYMGTEDRMSSRFFITYNALVAISNKIKSSGFKNPVILLPPTAYVQVMKAEDGIAIPEPAVFYYFTGLRAVCVTSPDVEQANLALLVRDHQLWIDLIKDKQNCDSFVKVFKHYLK